ncbi:hypothetical protein AB5N19_05763 [Seiridium cardinale]|uniref:Aminoglycoside phosphotransferase domain-containing protein n=1 Tax=Seiridium cardinale TaxID=138064 RepID=A0ABR2XH44_9PEZI
MVEPILNWAPASPVNEYLARINWQELCSRASRLNQGHRCAALDLVNAGLNHVIRILEFQDSQHTRWVVSIPKDGPCETKKRNFGLRAEVDVMMLLNEKGLSIPRIFDYELNADNPVGAAFILMEFLPGNVAMDAFGGWESHRGLLPLEYRPKLYSGIATLQKKLASVRFSKIGIVVRDVHGEYNIGPFPDLGGPFKTSSSFFEAWAQYAQFPTRSLELLRQMSDGNQKQLAHEISDAIAQFPTRLAEMAKAGYMNLKAGPFPVCHTDLMHSNIVVDEGCRVLGIIDWEGACTLPWEMVEYPLFLDTIPQIFNTPDKYDRDGKPLDDDTRQCWQDRETYLGMVRSAECTDHRLSDSLGDVKSLGLAYAVRLFNAGKLGFYDQVLDQYL